MTAIARVQTRERKHSEGVMIRRCSDRCASEWMNRRVILAMFRAGQDTYAIAQYLGITEYDATSHLNLARAEECI